MSYQWIESVEEFVQTCVEEHELDQRQAWTEVLEMAKANLDQLESDASIDDAIDDHPGESGRTPGIDLGDGNALD